VVKNSPIHSAHVHAIYTEKLSLLVANLNGVDQFSLLSRSNCEWKGHRQAKKHQVGTYNWVHVPQQRLSWSAGEISSVAPYLSQGALSRWAVPPARRSPPLAVGRTQSSRPPLLEAAWRADCNTSNTTTVVTHVLGGAQKKVFKKSKPCEKNQKPLDGSFHNSETNLMLAPVVITQLSGCCFLMCVWPLHLIRPHKFI
jgi:hypothetical protein